MKQTSGYASSFIISPMGDWYFFLTRRNFNFLVVKHKAACNF